MENEAIYDQCQKWLDIKRPSFEHLNHLIAKNVSSITAPLRFDKEMNTYLSDLYSTLVPFPQLHFMITSMATIGIRYKCKIYEWSDRIQGMAESCLSYQYFSVKLSILIFHPIHSY